VIRKVMTASTILILFCFAWLSISPAAYAGPPDKTKKTEKVEKKKAPAPKKPKKAPAIQKEKEPVKQPPKLPDRRKEEQKSSWGKGRDQEKGKSPRLQAPPESKDKSSRGQLKRPPQPASIDSEVGKKVKSGERYDYFRDTNGDGIDDRVKEKKEEKEKSAQKEEGTSP
jgi:type IV secretory pathway VirB10-like protein